jgi:hypothetical protein
MSEPSWMQETPGETLDEFAKNLERVSDALRTLTWEEWFVGAFWLAVLWFLWSLSQDSEWRAEERRKQGIEQPAEEDWAFRLGRWLGQRRARRRATRRRDS